MLSAFSGLKKVSYTQVSKILSYFIFWKCYCFACLTKISIHLELIFIDTGR